MEDKKNLLAAIVVALAIIVCGVLGFILGRPDVSVSVTSDGKPVVVSGGGQPSNVNVSIPSSEGEFGAYAPVASQETVWTSGKFTDDLTVTDSLAVSGNLTVAGTATITGTTTFSGDLSGVPSSLSSSLSSSATTTACTFLNSSGVTRTVLATNVVDRGSASSLGAITWQAGTSTASGANGSSAIVFTKAIDASVTRLSGVDVITTTSTLLGSSGAYYPWKNGEYWNFISGTTTNSGTCRVLYY